MSAAEYSIAINNCEHFANYVLHGLSYSSQENTRWNFARLLSRVKLGEEVIIAERGMPVAKLVPFRSPAERRASLGQDCSKLVVPDDFDAPLSENMLATFESRIE